MAQGDKMKKKIRFKLQSLIMRLDNLNELLPDCINSTQRVITKTKITLLESQIDFLNSLIV